jgi:CheY-like chemotaxis protein
MEKENKKKILVVDDDPNLRLVLVDKLNSFGFETTGAANGKDGLETAFKIRPDLILLDIMMPIMSGPEMLKHLRMDEWGKKVKVVMLTVLEDPDMIAQAIEDGSLAYLIKSDQGINDIAERVKEMTAY